MKKWLAGLLIIVLALVCCIYIFVPSSLIVSKTRIIKCSMSATNRYLTEESNWRKWWYASSDSSIPDKRFTCDGYEFKISGQISNSVEITASRDGKLFKTMILLVQLGPDSVGLRWETGLTAGINPVRRLINYTEAVDIKNCMTEITGRAQSFLEKSENIYGFRIQHTTIQDTFLVSKRITTPERPSTEMIYTLIGDLKEYISQQAAEETNFPMLNITENNDHSYSTMVAVAINKALAGNEHISLKRLAQIKDRTLVTEVRGGASNISKAFEAMENYIHDHNFTSPAVPFELLITDRIKEKDSSKWITRIYYPIV